MSADPDRVIATFRASIDAVNAALLGTLQTRGSLVRDLAAYKRDRGLPIVDAAREQEMLARIVAESDGTFSREAIERIFTVVFAESRRLALEA